MQDNCQESGGSEIRVRIQSRRNKRREKDTGMVCRNNGRYGTPDSIRHNRQNRKNTCIVCRATPRIWRLSRSRCSDTCLGRSDAPRCSFRSKCQVKALLHERKQQKKGGDTIAANPENAGADVGIKCRRKRRKGRRPACYAGQWTKHMESNRESV